MFTCFSLAASVCGAIWNAYCGLPNTSLKPGETPLEATGTLKPVSGTDLPTQVFPTAPRSAGVPAITNNVPVFLGLEVKEQWSQAVTGEAMGIAMNKQEYGLAMGRTSVSKRKHEGKQKTQ